MVGDRVDFRYKLFFRMFSLAYAILLNVSFLMMRIHLENFMTVIILNLKSEISSIFTC